MVRVCEKHGTERFEIKEAIALLLDERYDCGELEQLRYKINTLTEVVGRFLISNTKTVEELNLLAGWDRFKSSGQRTIIAGSRTCTRSKVLKEALEAIDWDISTVLCGMAEGADSLGYRWALANNIDIEEYPADWKTHGKRAGMVRNAEMADNADALIALWDGESVGTKQMIAIAKRKGLRVYVYTFTPPVSKELEAQPEGILNVRKDVRPKRKAV